MRGLADLAALFGAGLVPNLAYLALGLWLLRPLGLGARGAERFALAYALGTGFASLAILALRSLDLPIPLPALALLAVSGVLAPRAGGAHSAGPRERIPRWRLAVDGATALTAVLTGLAALGPETTWDGFEYHLPMIQAWSEGPIRALPGMLDAEFRAGVDLLYVPAVAAGQPDAAAAVSACFAVALALLVRAEAGRRATPGAGAWAGLFALIVPFTLDLSTNTYVDLGAGTYGFLALLLADRWNRDADTRALHGSALFLGLAVNAKLHLAILGPGILALLLLGGRRPRWVVLGRWAGVAALLALPWLVKTAITAGNPFFPGLVGWLGYGPTNPENLRWKIQEVQRYVRVERTLPGLFGYLTALTFGRTYHIGGLLGPLPLALGPLALHRLARPTRALLGVLAALLLLQFVFAPALRFGSPWLPFAALAAAVGGVRLARAGAPARRLLGTALVALALLHLLSAGGRLAPRLAALREPLAYERAIFPDQDALRRMVARAPPVVAIPKGAVSWMPKPVYNLHWSRNGELFFDQRTSPEQAWELLQRRGVRSLVLDVARPLGPGGSLGHPIADAWLREGVARLRRDVEPLPANEGRIWVLLELVDAPAVAAGGSSTRPRAAPPGGAARRSVP